MSGYDQTDHLVGWDVEFGEDDAVYSYDGYHLRVDTSTLSPEEGAEQILGHAC